MSHLVIAILAVGSKVYLPTGVLVALLVLGATQLAVFLIALVHLLRHPHPQLLPIWAWIVLMLALNLIGPLLYLAVGRQRAVETPPEPAEPAGDRSRRAVDLLYGRPEESADPGGRPVPTDDERPRGPA